MGGSSPARRRAAWWVAAALTGLALGGCSGQPAPSDAPSAEPAHGSVPSPPAPTAPPRPTTSIQQHGITVTFDEAVLTGRYATGDHWVIGPATVASISPAWDGDRHGAMVDPVSGAEQGYHRRVNGYEPELNVAARLPVTLRADESLVVTTGWLPGDPGAPAASWPAVDLPRPALRSAAVITVVDRAQPSDALRPPWADGPKDRHRLADVRWDRLLSLPTPGPPHDPPSWAELEARTRGPWLDHKASWTGYYLHPSDNMPHYGADIAAQLNETILALQLDAPREAKRPALIHTLQIGIDLFGATRRAQQAQLVDDGFAWHGESGGGIGSGRKWPILFAGLMLADDGMLAVGRDHPARFFAEDCDTYLSQGRDGEVRPAGEAAWADRHCAQGLQGRPVDDPYRRCCTSAQWSGAALGARLLGLAEEWDHDPFLDYLDWYMADGSEPGTAERASSPFVERMWDEHR